MVAERTCLVVGERISERICEQIADIHVPQVVGQVLEAPKISSHDLNLQGTVEQIPDVLVPEMVEQLVKLSKTVSVDRIQQRTVEHITVDTPVPQDVEEPGEFFNAFSHNRVQLLENPAIPLAEKIVELPVIQTEEKTQQGVNTHAQHVVDSTVEVERPKIIDETVQKPTIQEKLNQVTKHIKIPQVQFLDKADDMLVDVQRQIPVAQTMQKTMEVPPSRVTDKVSDIPVVAPRQILPMAQTVQKTTEILQLQFPDQVVDVPVVSVVQVPHVWVVKKTVEDPQFEIVEKTVENPETQISDVVIDACLTCDAKCKVACETCVKDNMFMVIVEITVAGETSSRDCCARRYVQHRI